MGWWISSKCTNVFLIWIPPCAQCRPSACQLLNKIGLFAQFHMSKLYTCLSSNIITFVPESKTIKILFLYFWEWEWGRVFQLWFLSPKPAKYPLLSGVCVAAGGGGGVWSFLNFKFCYIQSCLFTLCQWGTE